MKIKQNDFLKALDFLKPGVSSKEIVEQSTYIVFDRHSMSTFNDTVYAAVPLPDLDFTAAVLAAPFFDLVRKLPDGILTLALKDEKLQLRSAKTTVSINIQQEMTRDISETPSSLEWSPLPPRFINLAIICATAAAKTFSTPILTAIRMKGKVMQGCDNFRAVKVSFKKKIFPAEILLPSRMLLTGVWRNYEFKSFATSGVWFGLQSAEGYTVLCQTFPESKYPEIDSLFAAEGDRVEIEFPKELQPVLERVNTITGTSHNMVQENVKITCQRTSLVVEGTGAFGKIVERIKCKDVGEAAISFLVSPIALIDVLKYTTSASVGTDNILFAAKNLEYVACLESVEDEE